MSTQLLCTTCSKPITSEYVNLGEERNFHPECFSCTTCKKSLAGEQYFEMENGLYCENDYHKKFSPKCGGCGQTILDEYIEVLGTNYHKSCFTCRGCKKVFNDLQFFKHNGEPFCAECYENKAPKCHNCGKAILEKTYSAMNKTYHLECFVCEVCGKGFDQGAFVPHDNKPYHQECFRAKFGKKCWICNEDITGEYYELEGAPLHKPCYEKYKSLSPSEKNQLKESKGLGNASKSTTTTATSTTKPTTTTTTTTATATTKPTTTTTTTTTTVVTKTVEETKEHTPEPQKQTQTVSQTKPEAKKETKTETKVEVKADKVPEPSNEDEPEGSPSGTIFPYELLTKAPFPQGVDPTKREQYLAYREFKKIFQMSWQDFEKLPKWKQTEAKKKVKLF